MNFTRDDQELSHEQGFNNELGSIYCAVVNFGADSITDSLTTSLTDAVKPVETTFVETTPPVTHSVTSIEIARPAVQEQVLDPGQLDQVAIQATVEAAYDLPEAA